jgi:Ca2+-transporting ATPase
MDPVRPEIPDSIAACYKAGIHLIMITGDYPVTASNIGKAIGLNNHKAVLTGQQLALMTEDELSDKILETSVFARVVPEQKLQIVSALKKKNQIVAMTGDGVNDAPALKAAHIGIAMGKRGTDVAREASALVLLDDNFASITSAIRLGRRIYDNLCKVHFL